MAGGRGALYREDVQSGFDLAWGWDSEAGERVVFCIHTRVSGHVSDPHCSSLTRAAGWHVSRARLPQQHTCPTERQFGRGAVQAIPKYRINGGRDSEVIADYPHAPRRATPSGRPKPC